MDPAPLSEEAASRAMVRLLPKVDALHERFMQRAPVPESGSRLIGDDRATDPLQLSYAAWLALSHAADNLHGFMSVTVRGTPPNYRVETRPYGLYPTLRAAFENACVAVWLMSPPQRNVRVERRLRWALMDAKNEDKLLRCLGQSLPPRSPKRQRMVDDIAERRGLRHINWRRNEPSFSGIVREAGEAVPLGGKTSEVMWRLMSGMTHGDFSALLNMADREELAPFDTATLHFSVTARVSRVHMVAEIVHDMTTRAFGFYDVGAQAWLPRDQ